MTERRAPKLRRIAIWGVGLMGGSLGMAWKRAGLAHEVIGIDPAPHDDAVRLGAIDAYASSPAEGLQGADLVVLAAPVKSILAQAAGYAHLIAPGTVVTDVGSTKQAIVAAWDTHLPHGAAFVGGHPMCGKTVGGVTHASPDLAVGCRYLITPGERSTPDAIALVTRLAQAAGADVMEMSPTAHDMRVAYASHLPQVVATTLAATALAGEEKFGDVLALTAGGFRDTTRIAGSPVAIWRDIFLTNGPAISEALDQFQKGLTALQAAIEAGDTEVIAEFFAQAHEAKRQSTGEVARP